MNVLGKRRLLGRKDSGRKFATKSELLALRTEMQIRFDRQEKRLDRLGKLALGQTEADDQEQSQDSPGLKLAIDNTQNNLNQDWEQE